MCGRRNEPDEFRHCQNEHGSSTLTREMMKRWDTYTRWVVSQKGAVINGSRKGAYLKVEMKGWCGEERERWSLDRARMRRVGVDLP